MAYAKISFVIKKHSFDILLGLKCLLAAEDEGKGSSTIELQCKINSSSKLIPTTVAHNKYK